MLPALSVAEQFTVVVVIANVDPEAGRHEIVPLRPERASEAEALYVTVAPEALVASAVMLAGSVSDGLVRSTLTVALADALVLPAASVHVPLKVVPEVSVLCVLEPVHVTESLCTVPWSPLLAKLTVTLALFHPAPFGAGVTTAVGAFGAVLSILTVTLVEALVLPAVSMQVPLTTVPAVSVVRDVLVEQVTASLCVASGPASPLLVQLTVTLVLFQPAPFAAGLTEALGAFGAVLSILIVNEPVVVLPATSVSV
jgi:hypothetical protein